MVDQESVRPLAKSAAAKAKHTPAPGYEIVARAITGDDPPAWLVKLKSGERAWRWIAASPPSSSQRERT